MRRKTSFTFFCLIAFYCLPPYLHSQNSFTLSKNADFSTNDRVFARDDVLYMQVEASNIDFTDIDKNEFRLKPDEGGNDFEGQFANLLNGIYEASLSLSSADQSVTNWEWRGRIEDDSGDEAQS